MSQPFIPLSAGHQLLDRLNELNGCVHELSSLIGVQRREVIVQHLIDLLSEEYDKLAEDFKAHIVKAVQEAN